MRLLITGGAGFIGSQIADAALSRSWDVVCLDDMSSGRKENVPRGATLVQADIRDRVQLDKIFSDFRPEAVCHQAAQVSIAHSLRNPMHDASVNIMGSLQVLHAARKFEVERFVAASSGGAIYGEVAEGSHAAEDTLPTPISPYAVAKLTMESYMSIYREHHGLNSHALRYANVYGERQHGESEAGVVAIFANQILSGEPVQIYGRITPGDGGCIRDYIHVSDAVRANILALTGKLSPPVVNVCSGIETTTAEILEGVECISGKRSPVEQLAPRPGDIRRSAMANALCNQYLPIAMPLSEGLTRTVSWFQQQLGRNAP